jgi:tRNA U34 5-carboxymethylaminomethyl modifying enzyme MnmG/GidA
MKLSNEPYDVIVIGAGIAGLKAALELKDGNTHKLPNTIFFNFISIILWKKFHSALNYAS